MNKTLKLLIIFFSFFSLPKADAAIFTHNLIYSRVGEESGSSATLSAIVSFDDQAAGHNTDTHVLGSTLDQDFITDITYTYTPSAGAAAQELTYSNFEYFKIDHKTANTDFDSDPTLLSQLNDIQFQSFDSSSPFELTFTGTDFKVEVAGASADFLLTSTTYHSPAPLPVLGLLSSFSFMKTLKRKYKLNQSIK